MNFARVYLRCGNLAAPRQHWTGRLAGLLALVAASLGLVLLVSGLAGCCYVPSGGAAYNSPCAPTGRCKVYTEPHFPYRDAWGCRRFMGASAYRRYLGLDQGAPPDPQ